MIRITRDTLETSTPDRFRKLTKLTYSQAEKALLQAKITPYEWRVYCLVWRNTADRFSDTAKAWSRTQLQQLARSSFWHHFWRRTEELAKEI